MGYKSTKNITRAQAFARIQYIMGNPRHTISDEELEEVMDTDMFRFDSAENYSIVEEGLQNNVDEEGIPIFGDYNE